MTLKALRKQNKLTQAECASYLGMPLRTYQNYENDRQKQDSMKYQFMVQKLEKYGFIDETHGILSLERIKTACTQILESWRLPYCYLLGAYARGAPEPDSPVTLLLPDTAAGEALRQSLPKRVELLTPAQLQKDPVLLEGFLRESIRLG